MMVELILLQPDDRERFIKDNQWAFNMARWKNLASATTNLKRATR